LSNHLRGNPTRSSARFLFLESATIRGMRAGNAY
jgi:hypothetical protein